MRLLNRFQSRLPRRRPKGFVPRVESLESRLLLTCDVFQRGSTLFVHGDDANQAVQIDDDGRGNIDVTCRGESPASFSGVETVQVRLKGGDDEFSYLLAPLPDRETSPVNLDVELGDGADRANIDASGHTLGRLFVGTEGGIWRLDAGAGPDVVKVDLRNTGELDPRLALPKIDLAIEGGAGDGDEIDVQIEGFADVDLSLTDASGSGSVNASLLTPSFHREFSSALNTQATFNGPVDFALNVTGYHQVDIDLDLLGSTNTATAQVVISLKAYQSLDDDGNDHRARLDVDTWGATDFTAAVENFDQVDTSYTSHGDHRDNANVVYVMTVNPFAGLNRRDWNVDASLGGGDDVVTIEVRDGSSNTFFVGERNFILVDAGAGRDVVAVNVNVSNSAAADPSLPSPEVAIEIQDAEEIDVRLVNVRVVDLDLTGSSGRSAYNVAGRLVDSNPSERGGAVAVRVWSELFDPLPSLHRRQRLLVDSEGYEDVDLDLDLAAEMNVVQIGLLLPAIQKIPSAACVDLEILGDTRLEMEVAEYDHVHTSYTSHGDHSDVVHYNPYITVDSPVTTVSVADFKLGNGPNDLTLNATGFDQAHTDVLAGDGPNVVEVTSQGSNVVSIVDKITTGRGSDVVETTYEGSFDSIISNVRTGAGNDIAKSNYVGVVGYMDVSIDSGPGDDTIRFKPLFAFLVEDLDSRIHLDGGPGDDVIVGPDSSGSLAVHIFGGPGDDLVIGGAGPDRLEGGAGNDILIGGAGDDVLLGGPGRDVLIGGFGRDSLDGGGGGDLIIGGSTIFDDRPAALVAIRQEWTSHASYETRVRNLRTGGGPVLDGVRLEAQVTVLDDEAMDVLDGSGGRDWFFADLDGLDNDDDLLLNARLNEDIDLL